MNKCNEVCFLVDEGQYSNLTKQIRKEATEQYTTIAALIAVFAKEPYSVKELLMYFPSIPSLYELEKKLFTILGDFVTAEIIKELEECSHSGYASFLLGNHYYTGTKVKRNYHKAIYYLQRSADLGCSIGICRLAQTYLFAEDSPSDHRKGLYLLNKVNDKEYTLLNYYMGYLTEEINLNTKSMVATKNSREYLTKAAQKGFPSAIYKIGLQWFHGRREVKSVQYFREGSLICDPRCQYLFAKCLFQAKGIKKDIEKAFEWYKEAADNGNADAQYWCGYCYLCGMGTLRNTKKVLDYFKKATKQGHVRARIHLQYILKTNILITSYDEMIYFGIQEFKERNYSELHFRLYRVWNRTRNEYIYSLLDNASNYFIHKPDEAFLFYQSNALRGEEFSQYQMALCYYYGIHVQANEEKFISWLEKSSDQYFCSALRLCGTLYLDDNNFYEKDLTKAALLFNKAIFYGSVEARFDLVTLFQEFSLLKNTEPKKYLNWIKICSNEDISIAKYLLGNLYLKETEPYDNEDDDDENDDEKKESLHVRTEGISLCINAAINELAEAQLKIGILLNKNQLNDCEIIENLLDKEINENGLPAKLKSQKDIDWLKKSVKQGLASAQYYYGKYLLKKSFTDKNLKTSNPLRNSMSTSSVLLKKALKYLHLSSDQKYKKAEYQLGKYYLSNGDCSLAHYWFRVSAFHGHHKAKEQYILLDDEDRLNSPAPPTKGWNLVRPRARGLSEGNVALSQYESAAQMGFPGAMYSYALELYNKNDQEGALEWMSKAADAGMEEAQYQVGLYYKNGIGKKADFNTAKQYLSKAAEQGHSKARDLLQANEIQKLDQDEYMNFLIKNAENGRPDAIYQLGLIYAEGKIVNQDNLKAIEYFRKAMKQEHPGAKSNFVYFYKLLTQEQMNHDEKIDFLIHYAEDGYDIAQYDLAIEYYYGTHHNQLKSKITTPDYKEALHWFEDSAKQENILARYYCGLCYAKGHGTSIDYQLAIRYLLPVTEELSSSDEIGSKAIELLDWCYQQLKEQHLQSALTWYSTSPFYSKITGASKKKKKSTKIIISRTLPIQNNNKKQGDQASPKIKGVELYTCEISRSFLEGYNQIKYLALFNPSIRNFNAFLDGIDHLDAIKTFVFIDTEHTYHPNLALEIQGFIRRHKPTLHTLVFHFVGALPLLKWNETLPLQYFHLSDPTNSISKSEVSSIVQLIKRCKIPHIAIQGADSEETLQQIVSPLSSLRKSLQSYLFFEYTTTPKNQKEQPKTGKFHGTLTHILQSLSFESSGKPVYQRPTDYEYILMAKLAYKDDSHLMSKPSECFFWLSVCGWNLVTFHIGTGGYRAALFINHQKRQIVLASRGTKANNFGALYDDLAGVMLNGKVEQHKAAVLFLESIIDKKVIPNINIVPKCIKGMYMDIPGSYNEDLSGYQLSFTGHSLGAWLSEILVVESCLRGFYTFSVAFDCPGSRPMLEQICSDGNICLDLDQLDCTNYLSSPNIGKKKNIITYKKKKL